MNFKDCSSSTYFVKLFRILKYNFSLLFFVLLFLFEFNSELSKIKSNKKDGVTSSATQIFSKVLQDGKCSPVSIFDICLGCIQTFSASCSCVIFFIFRIVLTFDPKPCLKSVINLTPIYIIYNVLGKRKIITTFNAL